MQCIVMKEGKDYSLRVSCFLEGRQSFITMVTVTPRTYCVSAAGWPGSKQQPGT